MSWCTLPMVECLYCGRTFQVDDYYDLDRGDTIECPLCDEAMHIRAVDTSIEMDLVKTEQEVVG